MTKIKTGPFEQAVLDWLTTNGPAPASQIGEAIYAKTCGTPELELPLDEAYRKRIRSRWARKLLNMLRVKGKVTSEEGPLYERRGKLWQVTS